MAKKVESVEIWDKMQSLYGNMGLPDSTTIEVLSTGSHMLDDAMEVWGIPRGRIIQYAGKESSGKTLMSLVAIREWQKKNPKNWALFIDAEHSFDMSWARKIGVDVSEKRLKVFPCSDGAQIFERLCGVPHPKDATKPKIKPGLLDIVKEMGGSDESGLGIIVLDSIAVVQPPMEISSKSGKTNMALMARFMPPELRKIVPLLSEMGVTFIAINQVRTNPGQLFGNPETTPGGAAWKHACAVMIFFSSLMGADSKIENAEGEQIGHIMRARTDKNKVGSPKRTCDFHVEYVRGVVDNHMEVAQLGMKYGIVERPNNKTYIYDGNQIVGKDNFYNFVLESGSMDKMLQEVKQEKERRMALEPIRPGEAEEDDEEQMQVEEVEEC